MEQHVQMKNSGVGWIRDIPEKWGVRVLFQLVDQVKNKNKDLAERNLLSLSYGHIKRKDIDSPEGLLPESFDGYNIIEANDIVLRLTDLQNDHTSLRVGQAKERGIITSAYTTLRPSGLVNPQYLYYVLHAFDLIKGFYGMGSGVRQGLNYDEVKTIKVPFPSLEEQAMIVTCLGDRVSQIDSIITEAKESIEEYKSWKTSVVFETVTKGLNLSSPNKKCRASWIGKIPINWSIRKVNSLFELIGSGTTPNSIRDEYYAEDVPWLQSGDINGGHVRETAKKVSADIVKKTSALQVYNSPFIAIAMYGASIGNVSIVDVDACTNQACCVLSKPQNEVDLIYYFFSIQAAKNELILSSRGGTQPNISQAIIKQLLLPAPPYWEQKEIGKELQQINDQMNAIIMEKQHLVDDLEKYKCALIYEVVTGKRKVVRS